jgi:hypothetical protein
MSHYTVTVVLPDAPKSPQHVDEMLNRILAPFDENMEVEPYKDYVSAPPANWRTIPTNQIPWPYSVVRDHDRGIDLDDPEAVATWLNARYDGEEPRHSFDEQGLYQMSTYNPQSKWDWWVIGGRWTGFYRLKDDAKGITGQVGTFGDPAEPGCVDVARKGDIVGPGIEERSLQTYAVIDGEGEWHAPGRMGWFGMSSEGDNDRDQFTKWFVKFWADLPDETWLAVVDMHI